MKTAYAVQCSYTRRFNTRHKQWAHLFGGRCKSILGDGDPRSGEPAYLATLVDYIHLNPVRAGLRDARAILAETQRHFGLGKGELRNLPRGDLRHTVVGWAIYRRCCIPLSWVADQLNLKSAANAS